MRSWPGSSSSFLGRPIATDERRAMTSPAAQDPVLDAVGRHGALTYVFERQGARTVLARSSCSSPWHYFPPSALDDSGCAYTWLVNQSGGLVGGDCVTVEAQLGDGAHVLLTSPSANRVYRSEREPAVQTVRLTAGADARLEWLPDVTIPFAGSRFRQSIQVDLAPGATVALWDAMASGRVARNERWAFASYENEMVIRTASGQSAVERYVMSQDSIGESVKSWDYVGSLVVVGDSIEPERLLDLEAGLVELCEQQPGELLGGVSRPAVPGLAVKVVARSAPALTAFLEAAWSRIRASLWQLPAPALRRY
ncbi:MAG: Urease accessory protein UreD [Nitrospira sp.]|nr:MAG: Urease accessory protein UreD [Nitrospira sp.]